MLHYLVQIVIFKKNRFFTLTIQILKAKEIEKEVLKSLGVRIKDLRIKAGFHSQETFSYACGIPRAQYARYEKGSNITILSLQKIIKFHKLGWEDFFSEGIDL